MTKNNKKIRVALFENGMTYWKLARDILHISEATLSRKLRDELPEAEQDRIVKLIEEAAKNAAE